MDRRRIALIAVLGVAILLTWAAVARSLSTSQAGGVGETVVSPSPVPSAAPASTLPTDRPSPSPPVVSAPSATPAGTPTATPAGADPPVPTEDPRLRYLAFRLRLGDAGAAAAAYGEALLAAAEDGDRATVRSTSVDILQSTDGERDWLLAHPPATCYAPAHAAAMRMLEAYANVAEHAIDWTDATPGLDALDALVALADAGTVASDALAVLAGELEAATCLV